MIDGRQWTSDSKYEWSWSNDIYLRLVLQVHIVGGQNGVLNYSAKEHDIRATKQTSCPQLCFVRIDKELEDESDACGHTTRFDTKLVVSNPTIRTNNLP